MQNHSTTSDIAVINQGAGGNRILHDGLGPSVLSRVDRDVLSHANVHYAMIFAGVNDIGTADAIVSNQSTTGDRLIQAYSQIITLLHAHDIPIFASTITPFGAPGGNTTIQPYSNPLREKTRQRVNGWIRSCGLFDAVVDFDAVVRDPKDGSRLRTEFDSGDGLQSECCGIYGSGCGVPFGGLL